MTGGRSDRRSREETTPRPGRARPPRSRETHRRRARGEVTKRRHASGSEGRGVRLYGPGRGLARKREARRRDSPRRGHGAREGACAAPRQRVTESRALGSAMRAARRRPRAAPVAVARLRPPRGVAVAPSPPPAARRRAVAPRAVSPADSDETSFALPEDDDDYAVVARTRRSTWTRRRTARAGEAGRFATSRASWWAPRAPRSRRTRTPSRASARPWTTTSSTCPP